MHTFTYSIRIIKNLIITGLIDNYVLLFAPDFSWYLRNVVPTLFLDTFYSAIQEIPFEQCQLCFKS